MMKRIKKKSIPTQQVVFKTTIELNSSEYRKQLNVNSEYYNSFRLKPNNKYWFAKNEIEVSYGELEYELTKTIETELLSNVNEHLDDKLIRDVKVLRVNEGSIEIIFQVALFAGTAVLSGIIYDLIKFTAKKLLTRRLISNYGDFFDVDVMVTSSSIDTSPSIIRSFYKESGAFFYYLLYSNFFLMGIIFGIVLAIIFYLIRL